MNADSPADGYAGHVRPGPLRYGVAWVVAVLVLDTLGVLVLGQGLLVLLALSVANGLLLFYLVGRYVTDLLAYHGVGD